MKVGKPKSKRVPVRLRHKIEKASTAKQRKQRKEAKKNPQWRSKLKKDPGIPNLFPYKAKLLAEIEDSKRRKEEEAQRRRDVAKAQRQSTAVTGAASIDVEDEDEELLDPQAIDGEDSEEMDVQDEHNPMAALLASAQARAQEYDEEDEDEDEEGDEEDDDEWGGIDESGKAEVKQPIRKVLPKQALADPIKAVSALVERMQKTQDGIHRMLNHYNLPPLVTAGSDTTSRFLVEVARKCGRLGRGGVPNLHAAALIVLNDLNEDRLQLPAVESQKKDYGKKKSAVHVVSKMAEPFRIEGLWGDDGKAEHMDHEAMAVET